jgi:hypothetical protein
VQRSRISCFQNVKNFNRVGKSARFSMIVLHDDAEREYAYGLGQISGDRECIHWVSPWGSTEGSENESNESGRLWTKWAGRFHLWARPPSVQASEEPTRTNAPTILTLLSVLVPQRSSANGRLPSAFSAPLHNLGVRCNVVKCVQGSTCYF